MYERALRAGLLLVMLAGSGSLRARAVEATLVADAHVNAARPGVNSGAISNVNVGGGYTGLMQFDLGSLPTGTAPAQIARAVLRVYVNRVDTAGLVSVAPLTSAWSEYGVTYGTLPGMGSAAQVFTVSQAGQFVALDVTALVQGWVAAPATNFGLGLTAGTAVAQFDSKENDLTAHPATLDLTIVSQGPAGATGAAGPVGPPGPAGAAGPSGLPGAAGPSGPPGVAGVAGPQGPKGLPGLGFQGVYASGTNYGLDDVVSFQGSSYISLLAGNHGNTPSLSPAQWAVLASQGPQGSTGATGAAGPQGGPGPQGPTGPPGAPGPAGLQGIAGQAGAQGLTGETGPPGLSGPAGPQGAAGPVGLTFRGAYDSAANYALADGVAWLGASYVSTVTNNHGNTPDQSPAQWTMFAAAGAAGPQGPPVVNYRGDYVSTSNYGVSDAVSFGGSTYVSLLASNHGNTPGAAPEAWAVLAAEGPQGPPGPAGATGAAGATGPQGVPGSPGPQGPPVTFHGSWLTGTAYAIGDAVSYGGGSYIALVANMGREPDISPIYWGSLAQAGAAGAVGPPGATGLQGPTGYPGPPGPPGAAGAAGATGPAGPVGADRPNGSSGGHRCGGSGGRGRPALSRDVQLARELWAE